MSHENSRTMRGPDGLHYNVHGTTGRVLQGPFNTQEDAVWHARQRSDMTPPEWGAPQQMPELGDLENQQNQQSMGQHGKPEPTEYTPDEYPADIFTAQATKDPYEAALEQAERGETPQRPTYMGEQGAQTQAISQPSAAPQHPATQDNPKGESWGQYLRRTLLGG